MSMTERDRRLIEELYRRGLEREQNAHLVLRTAPAGLFMFFIATSVMSTPIYPAEYRIPDSYGLIVLIPVTVLTAGALGYYVWHIWTRHREPGYFKTFWPFVLMVS